jgi:hypothetical protein
MFVSIVHSKHCCRSRSFENKQRTSAPKRNSWNARALPDQHVALKPLSNYVTLGALTSARRIFWACNFHLGAYIAFTKANMFYCPHACSSCFARTRWNGAWYVWLRGSQVRSEPELSILSTYHAAIRLTSKVRVKKEAYRHLFRYQL